MTNEGVLLTKFCRLVSQKVFVCQVAALALSRIPLIAKKTVKFKSLGFGLDDLTLRQVTC